MAIKVSDKAKVYIDGKVYYGITDPAPVRRWVESWGRREEWGVTEKWEFRPMALTKAEAIKMLETSNNADEWNERLEVIKAENGDKLPDWYTEERVYHKLLPKKLKEWAERDRG